MEETIYCSIFKQLTGLQKTSKHCIIATLRRTFTVPPKIKDKSFYKQATEHQHPRTSQLYNAALCDMT